MGFSGLAFQVGFGGGRAFRVGNPGHSLGCRV